MKRHVVIENVLKETESIVNGRGAEYGDIRKLHQHVANLWSAWIGITDAPLSASDVLQMMSMLKKSRSKHGMFKRDNYVDDMGYTSLATALDAEDLEAIQGDGTKTHVDELGEAMERVISEDKEREKVPGEGVGSGHTDNSFDDGTAWGIPSYTPVDG